MLNYEILIQKMFRSTFNIKRKLRVKVLTAFLETGKWRLGDIDASIIGRFGHSSVCYYESDKNPMVFLLLQRQFFITLLF